MATIWRSWSPTGRWLRGIGWVVYALLIAATLRDLSRRPAEQVKGNKRLWTVGQLMLTAIYGYPLPVAPIAYWLFGRRRVDPPVPVPTLSSSPPAP